MNSGFFDSYIHHILFRLKDILVEKVLMGRTTVKVVVRVV
jgi:hypothetical protein